MLSLRLQELCYGNTKCKRQGLHLIKVICVYAFFSKHSDWTHALSLPPVSFETIYATVSEEQPVF